MHNETKTMELICPYCTATFYNLANLKQHVLNKSCANKQQGTKTVPWDDIVEHNQTQGGPHDMNKISDLDRGTFERKELLFGRITVANQAEGVAWGFNLCDKTADAKRKLRNHLSTMNRKTNAGEVCHPYCAKEHKHRKPKSANSWFRRAEM